MDSGLNARTRLRTGFDHTLIKAMAQGLSLDHFLADALGIAVHWLGVDKAVQIDAAVIIGIGTAGLINSIVGRGPRRNSARALAQRSLREGRTLCAVDRDWSHERLDPTVASLIATPLDGTGGCVGSLYLDSETRSLDGVRARRAAADLARMLSFYVDLMQAHQRARARARRAWSCLPTRDLFGRTEIMERVRERIAIFGAMDQPVLVLGEIGTGKSVVARALHRVRGRGVLLSIETPTYPAGALEREAFGDFSLAFDRADSSRDGFLVEAGQGSVALIDLDALSLRLQGLLAQTLRRKRIISLDLGREVPFVARLIATSSRDLAACVRTRQFAPELLEQLESLVIRLPPLRLRRADIPILAKALEQRAEIRWGERLRCRLSPDSYAELQNYTWPGNVSELQLFLRDLALRAKGRQLRRAQVRGALQNWRKAWPEGRITKRRPASLSLAEAKRQRERQLIRFALQISGGTQVRAADYLQLPESTLRRRIQRLNLLYSN